MYIMTNNFIGNFVESELTKLKNDIFIYTNDGKIFKPMKIDKNDLSEGILTNIYTYFTIKPWTPKEILNSFKDNIVKEVIDNKVNRKVYIKLTIDENNNCTKKELIDRDLIDIIKYSVIKPMEINNLVTKEKIDCKVDGQYDIKVIDKRNAALGKKCYYAHLCTPTMHWNENVKQYTFDIIQIISYIED